MRHRLFLEVYVQPPPTSAWLDLVQQRECEQCAGQEIYDPSDNTWCCFTCLGPERVCRCGARTRSVEGHTACYACRSTGHKCGCRTCRGDQAARDQYHAELRELRRTAGGTVEPLPDALYAAVVASGPCVYCGAAAEHADHVWALARGGGDDMGNLAPACAACNNSKGPKLLTEWDADRVAHGVRCSPVVAVEYARLTRTVVAVPSSWAAGVPAQRPAQDA